MSEPNPALAMVLRIADPKNHRVAAALQNEYRSELGWAADLVQRVIQFFSVLSTCDFKHFGLNGLDPHLPSISAIDNFFIDFEKAYPDYARIRFDDVRDRAKGLRDTFGPLYTALVSVIMYASFSSTGKTLDLSTALGELASAKAQAGTLKTEIATLSTDAKNKIQAVEKAVESAIRLQQAHVYWQRKGGTHRNFSLFFFLVVCGLIVGAGLLLKCMIESSFAWHQYQMEMGKSYLESINFGKIAMTALIALTALWLLKIFGRLFLGSVHSYYDAGERVVMVNTYLALQAADKDMPRDLRSIMLASLFRPSPANLEVSDFTPDSPYSDVLHAVRSKVEGG